MEVIKRTRLITGGQHLITLHRTVLMAAGLAGGAAAAQHQQDLASGWK